MTIRQRLIKRALDIFFSFLGLCIFWPLMLFIAFAIRCSSPGPIIFRQLRVGRQGRLFNFYKFRSMSADHGNKSTVTVSGDGRITPVGAFLRRWKLDELPQLWNVLKGDMSFGGPRPDVPGFADRLTGGAG